MHTGGKRFACGSYCMATGDGAWSATEDTFACLCRHYPLEQTVLPCPGYKFIELSWAPCQSAEGRPRLAVTVFLPATEVSAIAAAAPAAVAEMHLLLNAFTVTRIG